MSSDYTGAPGATQAPGPQPSLAGGYPIGRLPADGDALAAASVQQDHKEALDFIAYLQDTLRTQIYGDGSDGDLTNPGILINASPKFYNTVTIGAACNVEALFPIICRTKFTLNHASASLRCNGGNASTSTRGSYVGNLMVGPHGSIAPSNGLASGSYPYTGMAHWGLGGSGGAGGGGGTSGTQIYDPGAAYKMFPYRYASGVASAIQQIGTLFAGSANVYPGLQFDTIRGGGAGGSGGVAASSTGGAGGAGGGLVIVIAPTIELLAGSCSSIGGAGGAGQGTTGHGGGGGGGGAFLFICKTFTNAGLTFTVTGGAGGLGVGAGSPGTAGTAGNATPFVVVGP